MVLFQKIDLLFRYIEKAYNQANKENVRTQIRLRL